MPSLCRHRSRSTMILGSLGFILVLAAACVSGLIFFPSIRPYLLTTSRFDGFFPSGEYHFRITNQAGESVHGASFRVFEYGKQNPAFGYPIDNYLADGDLISDDSGVIITVHRPRGFEFGGGCTHFLIVFTIRCDKTPSFDFVITADGYKPLRISDQVIYDLDYDRDAIGTTKVLLDNGREDEVPVFELVYPLEQ